MKRLRFLLLMLVWLVTGSRLWQWFWGTMEPRK